MCLVDLNKGIMMSVFEGVKEINDNQNKMRLKDENAMSMIGNGFINKISLVTQVLGNINMALQHVQGAVNSHSNAGIAAQGRLNRGVRQKIGN